MIPRIEMRRHPGYEGQTKLDRGPQPGGSPPERRTGADRARRPRHHRRSARRHTQRRAHEVPRLRRRRAEPQDHAEAALGMLDGLEDVGPVGALAELLGG